MKPIIYGFSLLLVIACKSNSTPTQPVNQNTQVVLKDQPKPSEIEEPVNDISDPVVEESVVKKEDYTSLRFNVDVGISRSKPDWVLFKNGTYIIFPSGYTDEQMTTAAKNLLDSYNSQSISVNKSNFAKGWIGSTTNGIYTFVSQEALGLGIHSDQTLVNAAVSNIVADKKEKKVVHINRKK